MSEPATRPVLLHDDDGELFGTLARLAEILIQLQPFDEDDEPSTPGVGPDELHAVDRVLMQLHATEQSACADLYARDGRFHYGRLRVFCPLVEDLDAIGRTLKVIGPAARNPHPNYIQEVIEEITGSRPVDFLDLVERAYRALNLEPDEDHGLLCRIVTEHTDRVDLDVNQEGAYRRWINRLLDIRGNDPLERFLYLGNATSPPIRR